METAPLSELDLARLKARQGSRPAVLPAASGGRRLAFQWFGRTIRFRTRREVLRFLYCHEFYHWYLREVRGGKGAAETACDRFALTYFRARNRGIDWSSVLPGYPMGARRPLKPAA